MRMVDEPEFLLATPSRRIATRYVVRIPVGLRIGEQVIDATIVDISDSGARVECDPPGASAGANVSIELRCFRLEERVNMLATFVRETPGGCALRLADVDPFLRVFVKLAMLFDEAPGDRLEKELSQV
jgi:hypothetical protein